MRQLFVHIPINLYHKAARIYYRVKRRKSIFIEIYKKNGFMGVESVSGPGSSLKQTNIIRRELPELLKALDVRSLLDAPCGDFNWMKDLSLDIESYIGIDIVPDLIRINSAQYSNGSRRFICLDIVKDSLPSVDLILCRDCFVHLAFFEILRALRNFSQSNSKYILTTTFTSVQKNEDIITGFWRPINLQRAPFNFPAPIKIINEGCTEGNGMYPDKCLGLWKLDHLMI